MNYQVKKDEIIIEKDGFFDVEQTLECGQIFRYKRINEHYRVYSLDKYADLYTNMSDIVVKTQHPEYFVRFFDLDTDYGEIVRQLENKGDFVYRAVQYGKGIRILRQDPFETLISFIISANNNIKRIATTIEKLCVLTGERIDEGNYAFPTLAALQKLSQADFEKLGCGYRAKYLATTAKALSNFDLCQPTLLRTEEAKQLLLSLCGVGPKVADCVLLFAYTKTDCFPTDTWIKKSYSLFGLSDLSAAQSNAVIISKQLSQRFGKLSGYAQQYVFYYARQKKFDKSIDK